MSWTTTITFPEEQIGTGDYIQLIMVIDHNLTVNLTWDAEDYGLKVLSWGNFEASYDLESLLLVPSSMDFELGDIEDALHGKIFDNQYFVQPQVTIKLNGSTVFVGYVLEDSVQYSMSQKKVNFTAAPRVDIINNTSIYDDEGDDLDPLSYGASATIGLITMLQDIFQLVNPSITYSGGGIEIYHDWEFYGQGENAGVIWSLPDIAFEKLKLNGDKIFFNSTNGLSNLGSLLRKLARDFGAFVGMDSTNRAFFKKLFYYDSSNVQTLDLVIDQTKNYKYALLKYIKIKTSGLYPVEDTNAPYIMPSADAYTTIEGASIIDTVFLGFWGRLGGSSQGTTVTADITTTDLHIFDVNGVTTAPAIGDVYSTNSSEFTVTETYLLSATGTITTERTSGTNDPATSGTLTRVSGSGDVSISFTDWFDESGSYDIFAVKDAAIDSGAWKNHGELLTEFWYDHRKDLVDCRVDKFLVSGVDYDLLKNFTYNGEKFQPIGIKIMYAQGLTEFEALYVGDV